MIGPKIWHLVFPNGIKPSEYERAYLLAQLAEAQAAQAAGGEDGVTPIEAARLKGVHTSAISSAIRRGALEARRVGRRWRISEKSLALYTPEKRRRKR